jgi:hypothetical protein
MPYTPRNENPNNIGTHYSCASILQTEGKTQPGKYWDRREDEMKMDLNGTELERADFIQLSLHRGRWQFIVNMAVDLLVL